MSRKTLAAGLGIAAIAAAIWFAWFRHRDRSDAPAHAEPTAVATAPASTPAPAHADERSPQGRAPTWIVDADPDGTLRLEGQVVDADGHAVAGAEVWLGSVPPRSTQSAEDGSFAFDKLVGRTYQLTAGHGALVGGPVTHRLGEHSDPIVIALREGASVEVSVIDEQQRPVTGAEVKVPDVSSHAVRTDDRGKATLAGVHPGWIAIEANAAGFAPATAVLSIGSAGGKGSVSVTLRKGASVSGRVIDEAGHPLARVKVRPESWRADRSSTEQTTDDKGQFTFAALPAGSHALSASDGEHEPTLTNPITVTADHAVTGIQITMKAGAIVRGVVVDAAGNAARNATVRVMGKGAAMWRTAARQATCDAQGKFELRGLARAKLEARAESELAASSIVDLDTTSQAIAKDIKLVLDVTGTIAGVVVDDAGQPVPEILVNAFPDVLAGQSAESIAIAGMSSATTDGAGRFAIHGLPDGAYRLWAGRHVSGFEDSWGGHSTPAKVGDTGVRIVMAAPGGLVGKLVLENGSVPKLAYVELGVQTATPADAGAFKLQELEPGTYDLRVFGPEFSELVRRDVHIESGKTLDLGTLTLLRGRKLVGRVVDGGGTPVAGARVKLGEMLMTAAGSGDDANSQSYDDVTGVRSAVTDQDGAFLIQGLPAKTTTAMADHPDRGRSTAITIPPGTGDPPAVTLALHPYGSITGKVTQKGQSLANVLVSESMKGGSAQATFARTAADGTFTLPQVPEGTHVVSAMQQGMMTMKSTSVTVQVSAGKPTNVTIDIPAGTISLTVNVHALPGQKVDAAQVFLLSGAVTVATGRQLLDGFFQGSLQGMKFWFGQGKPSPQFDELVAGDYSVCAIPITGDLSDPQFMQRVQENVQTLAVYCKPLKIAASPDQQSFDDGLPAMTPLPAPKS
jgi:protocatechuate 3,4-dioxygenase beta subunit